MIDLHIHSTFSDGSLTPEALAGKAREANLTAVALTDHDCTDGVERFVRACAERAILGLSGVELSVEVERGTLHLLGYCLDAGNAALRESLRQIRNGREIRNVEILARLNKLGMALTWDDVASCAGGDNVGRVHFAQAMLTRGYVSSRNAAFDRYLAKGKPAYVERFRLSPEDGIAAIRGAGGVPVLAHPLTLEMDPPRLAAFLRTLKAAGLAGVEAYYPEHTPAQAKEYLALADGLQLIATGGSDFHGDSNPAIGMGVGFGGLKVPDRVVEDLLRARESILTSPGRNGQDAGKT